MEAPNGSKPNIWALYRVRCAVLRRAAILVALGILFLSVAAARPPSSGAHVATEQGAGGSEELDLTDNGPSVIKDRREAANTKKNQQSVETTADNDDAKDGEENAQKTTRSKMRKEQQTKLLETMNELLSENREYRKMKADRERKKLLQQYQSEDDDLDPEESPAFIKDLQKFKNLQKKKSFAGAASIVSMALASAGMLVYWMANKKGEFLEREDRKVHKRNNMGLIASSLAGAIGVGLTQLQRRRYKKKLQRLQQKLVRMEKEAYAGHMPEDTPFLGADEESPEDKRKREKAKRLQEQQQQKR
ncbi:putative transmembrane protein [Toxoplasma gondii TgCatPRC2]|uniref:Transmembrane protein n=5 Tax=Toxoplasma gondii TaxID=5811 RepID=A0A125YXK9_TOXGM|nr:hypothetical protein TGME49_291910 [Toxoplasma gondii ME49]ESS33995.1 putative transmembrane protein [Toxoplasma gondii VEG]KYF44941.1 hypothetical protein TGARI_291910 [Toxoplasma gondii ARI]KYK69760.1 putative transmembrane protein [Toxoplasma gondii TgCatPRC2]PIM00492.1 putative transmembrane protein [Toxoplasma gondii COUG]EPT28105.1 hypothetical protein TGME49_291910 [Toxoplasma gondii ME49]|eukprot:XP_002368533.1 hypothetical protein TGME49_291910 [Toxoplasma gondii ME49]